jgi:hypothetical protein
MGNPVISQRRSRRVTAGVDAAGKPVVDPTENVIALVEAEKNHAAELRATDQRHAEQLRAADLAMTRGMAQAETRRLTDLGQLLERYQARIASDLAINVRAASDQLARQLVKETGSLSNQIVTLTNSMGAQINVMGQSFSNQIGTLRGEIMPRLGELDKFRFETGGRSSVQDPATATALRHVADAVSSQKGVLDTGRGSREGMNALSGWLVSIIMTIVAVASLMHPLFAH